MPVISTNTAANSALRYLNYNSDQQSENLSRIASGSRITKASDDASGLAIGTKLQTDVATLTQAQTNAANGASILSVADGGMASISDILSRMKTLATQSVSGTVTDTERAYIQAEIDELALEITSIATATSFNGESLLDGTSDYATGVVFMAGTESTDTLTVTITDVDATALAVAALDVETDATTRTAALAAIDAAINTLATARAEVGAQMSRFEFRESMLATSLENTDAAASAIMDADIASEQAELASNEVKTQAAIAALASANELPQELLDLLR
ncbi:flagellin [Shumkonia mesophila]|uniref:flagellin n=1 Tax=Shumkonia mesophila TaxID=2838854 RepID=UPI0029346C5B|nr:flagellin [Shumkonia mesophila]